MVYLLLAPVLALLFDYAGQHIPSKKIWINIIVGILTVPSIIIWAFQYNYSRTLHWQIAIASLIFSFFVSIFIRIDRQFKVKALAVTVATVAIACYGLFTLAMVGFVGGNTDMLTDGGYRRTGTAYKHYIAYVIEPSLYSTDDVLVVYKRRIFGIIEKQVAYIWLSDNPEACECFFADGRQQLKYDRCKDTLSSN
jgi:hypothetical protein